MNILVCVSRVPDTATKVMVGGDGISADSKGVKFIVSPYDELAIEEGLRLKEKNGGNVTVISVGSPESTEVLRTALAMGADDAILVKCDNITNSFFVAKNIAESAKKMNPDIILLGRQSVDYDSLQMTSMLAELLDLPSISVVSKLTVDGNKVTAERDIEGGKELLESTLPCVVSCQKGLNDPRYPKLPDIMKAKKKPIEEVEAIEVIPTTTVIKMELPRSERAAKIMGDTDADIDELVRLLHESAKVI